MNYDNVNDYENERLGQYVVEGNVRQHRGRLSFSIASSCKAVLNCGVAQAYRGITSGHAAADDAHCGYHLVELDAVGHAKDNGRHEGKYRRGSGAQSGEDKARQPHHHRDEVRHVAESIDDVLAEQPQRPVRNGDAVEERRHHDKEKEACRPHIDNVPAVHSQHEHAEDIGESNGNDADIDLRLVADRDSDEY